MKKIIALALTAILLSAMALTVSAAPGGLVAEAQYGTPVIDGKMDDAYAACTENIIEAQRNGTDTGTRGSFRVLWDENYIYIYEFVSDKTLFGADDTIANYQYDTTEVCMDLSNTEDTAYDLVNDWWIGTTPYGDLNPDAKSDALGTDYANMKVAYDVPADGSGYAVEWAFNVKAIDSSVVMAAGTEFGLEISINDNAENDVRTMCLGWNDLTDGASGNPAVFGQITLMAAPAAEAAPVAEPEPEAAPAAVEAAPVEEAPVVISAAPQTADPIIAVIALLAITGTAIVTRRK